MRAVNLMPEGGRGRVGSPTTLVSPANGLIALLVVALALMAVYVVSSNSVSSRKVKLVSVQRQLQTAQAQANQLSNYVAYQKLAAQRATTIQQLVTSRFDWHAALLNLSRVVPPNVAFQSLLATAAPGSSVAGAGGSVGGGAGTGSLRSDIPNPAFEIKGCAPSHDDVARLLSRLRVMPGVQRVTLADSVRPTGTPGASASSSSADRGPSACGPDPATFDLVIFFAPLPGTTTTATTSGAAPVSTPAGAANAASSATSTTTTTTASAQPVSTGSSG